MLETENGLMRLFLTSGRQQWIVSNRACLFSPDLDFGAGHMSQAAAERVIGDSRELYVHTAAVSPAYEG